MTDVINLINQYKGSSAHYYFSGQPFVSTFEGPERAKDWTTIKGSTGCYFVPDWSSRGAKAAMELAGGVADGLFSWAAWPWGPRDMDTYVDASYLQFLNGKPYMMPVSPWFYTNMPGFDKNWLWRGDDMWFDRWLQVQYWQPEWVQIITWNDYGESHHIGPIYDKAVAPLMARAKAPYDYITGLPHDGWRKFLPYTIDMYKRGSATFTEETVVFWYRPNPAAACSSGGTSANTASQLQYEYSPVEVAQDKVFFTAQLASAATVAVSIGGVSQSASWSDTPAGSAGLYHGSAPFNGRLGDVVITVSRGGGVVSRGTGKAITTSCTGGFVNWNAWVGQGSSVSVGSTAVSATGWGCIAGTAVGNFAGLCEFSCRYDYCPQGACVCTKMGPPNPRPTPLNVNGYPAAGLDENYSGLCAFNCNYGYCPPSACATTPQPLTTPTVSPFAPPACTSGEGDGNFGGLCSYACNFGFCPRAVCRCNSQGALNVPPPITKNTKGKPVAGVDDHGLCAFACPRGYCPDGACQETAVLAPGAAGPPVTVDPQVWRSSSPTVSCVPPCVVVLPPWTLPTQTTISFPPFTTTITASWVANSPATITTVTVTFPAITTSIIPVYNLNITASGVSQATYTVSPSIIRSNSITISPPPDVDVRPVTLTITSRPPDTTATFPTMTLTIPTVVSFTSATPPGPTCTSGSGCGQQCTDNCNSCGLLCACWWCIPPVGIFPPPPPGFYPPTCVGPVCPIPIVPDGDDDDCNPSDLTTVRRCTVSCSVTKKSTEETLSTTCTRTDCTNRLGCGATSSTTTTRTTFGCPTAAIYRPWWTDVNQAMPSPLAPGFNAVGTVLATGTWSSQSAGPTPPPDSNNRPAIWTLVYWREDTNPVFRGYNFYYRSGFSYFPDICHVTQDWTSSGGGMRGTPDSLSGVTVWGRTGCSFSKSSMTLSCPDLAPARCNDDPNYVSGVGGTCQSFQEYRAVMFCYWGAMPK